MSDRRARRDASASSGAAKSGALYPHTTTTTAVASVRARVVERARCAVR